MSDLLVHTGAALFRAEVLLEGEGGAALVVVPLRTEAVPHSTRGTAGRVSAVASLRPALVCRLGGTRGVGLELGAHTAGVGSAEIFRTLLLAGRWR